MVILTIAASHLYADDPTTSSTIATAESIEAIEGMATISAGAYTPLYRENGVVKKVQVTSFYLDKYQVTNQQFTTFLADHPKWQPTNISPNFADSGYLNHLSLTQYSYSKIGNTGDGKNGKSSVGSPNSPVVNVSWYAAMAYCRAQGKTLPTVDQWEYAARASAHQANGVREEAFRQKILQWYSRPATSPVPVDKTEGNFWGVHGMHGVVWEQTKDFNNALVTGESRADGTLDNQFFCGAGASQAVDPSDYAAFMRYAFRSSYQASYTLASLGFRCAKAAE